MLKESMLNKNHTEVANAFHAIKGSLYNAGAKELAELAGKGEKIARENSASSWNERSICLLHKRDFFGRLCSKRSSSPV